MRGGLILGILVPIYVAAQNYQDRLNLLIKEIGGNPCEVFTPGVGKVQVGSRTTIPGVSIVLLVQASHMDYTPRVSRREIGIKPLDRDVIPFIYAKAPGVPAGGPQVWDTTFHLDSTTGTWECTLRIYRATFYQWGAYPKDITEYVFIVEDVEGGETQFYPDTSNPLDSIFPGIFDRLLLVVPGTQHYPGDWVERIGYTGIRRDLPTVEFHEFWVYGVDRHFNAVRGTTPPPIVFLRRCDTRIKPYKIVPDSMGLYTEVNVNGENMPVAKTVFKVSYRDTGWAGLMAVDGGKVSECEKFVVVGAPPDAEDPIVVYPNPGGTPGCPIHIHIHKVWIADIKVKIFDSFGHLVRDLSEDARKVAEKEDKFFILSWDCTNDKGYRVANGVYHLCVQIFQAEEAAIWKKKIGVVW
jgi:hypothetical protein